MKKTVKTGDEMVSHMPDEIGNFVWAISGLTRAIGEEFTTSTDEGRCVSWSDGECGYFLTLVLDDRGKARALISDHEDEKKTYAAIGYCRYHGITIELSWEKET